MAAGNPNDRIAPPGFRQEETAEKNLERKIWKPMLIHPIKSPPFRTLESSGGEREENSPHLSESEVEKDGDEEEGVDSNCDCECEGGV